MYAQGEFKADFFKRIYKILFQEKKTENKSFSLKSKL